MVISYNEILEKLSTDRRRALTEKEHKIYIKLIEWQRTWLQKIKN